MPSRLRVRNERAGEGDDRGRAGRRGIYAKADGKAAVYTENSDPDVLMMKSAENGM